MAATISTIAKSIKGCSPWNEIIREMEMFSGTLDTIVARLKEPSTQTAIGALLMATGFKADSMGLTAATFDLLPLILEGVGALLCAFGIGMPEKGKS